MMNTKIKLSKTGAQNITKCTENILNDRTLKYINDTTYVESL